MAWQIVTMCRQPLASPNMPLTRIRASQEKPVVPLRHHPFSELPKGCLNLYDAVITKFTPYGLWKVGLNPSLVWFGSYGASREKNVARR